MAFANAGKGVGRCEIPEKDDIAALITVVTQGRRMPESIRGLRFASEPKSALRVRYWGPISPSGTHIQRGEI